MRTEKPQVEEARGREYGSGAQGGTACSSEEVPKKRMERMGYAMEPNCMSQPAMGGVDE